MHNVKEKRATAICRRVEYENLSVKSIVFAWEADYELVTYDPDTNQLYCQENQPDYLMLRGEKKELWCIIGLNLSGRCFTAAVHAHNPSEPIEPIVSFLSKATNQYLVYEGASNKVLRFV